jgi:phage terminase small subunit
MAKKIKLTPKQQNFVDEYVLCLNASEAARKAGYSPKTSAKIGSENLQRQYILDAIQVSRKKLQKRTEVTIDRVINELSKSGFMDIREAYDNDGNLLPVDQLPDSIAACVVGVDVTETWIGKGKNAQKVVTTKLKLMDKKGSLQLIGQHLGAFPANVKVTAKVDHEHNHKHQHEVLPSTDDFLKQFAESGEDTSSEAPGKNRPVLLN